ncbi:small ribosomal subunit protein RACK1-like [Prorops nasuta]|uniref:small ribosomal subunit protein RACK1-like n=1 Tax=Prorops nasuta TaxID=863751 RepID=UPI0034CE58EE
MDKYDTSEGWQSKRKIDKILARSMAYTRATESENDQKKSHRLSHYETSGFIQILNEIFTDLFFYKFREAGQQILCVNYTETGEYLAAGLSNGTIELYKNNSKHCALTLQDAEIIQNPAPTTAIKRRPPQKAHPVLNTLTATYANGCVKCWHHPSKQCLYTVRELRETLGLAYHPLLPKFVTVGNDANIYLYDEECKIQERVFHRSYTPDVMDGHTSKIFGAVFNPKSWYELISGGWDDTVQFWDTRQPHAFRHLEGVHICGDALDISRNGKEIITCSWQRKNTIQLWDYGSGKLIVNIEPDDQSSLLYCGKYINNYFVACGGVDINLFRVVDLRSHSVSFSQS